MYKQDNDPIGEQGQITDEEEINEILLQPLQQGRYTYDPKPPSQYWLEIEQRYHEQQRTSGQLLTEGTERIKKRREEMNKRHDKFLDPNQPKAPNQPNNWWYVPKNRQGRKMNN